MPGLGFINQEFLDCQKKRKKRKEKKGPYILYHSKVWRQYFFKDINTFI